MVTGYGFSLVKTFTFDKKKQTNNSKTYMNSKNKLENLKSENQFEI